MKKRALLTFLGTGTSTGNPEIGCACRVCLSKDDRDIRLRSSALIEWEGGVRFLLDCGPDFRQQALRYPFPNIDAVFVTHEHYDHIGGLDDLRPFCRKGPLSLYLPLKAVDGLKRRIPYSFDEHPYPGVPLFDLHPLDCTSDVVVCGIPVAPVEVMHYQLPILGYRFGSMAYITDMKTISSTEEAKLYGLDLLVLNALRLKTHISHHTLSEALAMIERLHPKRTYLIHPSHELGLYVEIQPLLPEGVFLAYDGLQVEAEITFTNPLSF